MPMLITACCRTLMICACHARVKSQLFERHYSGRSNRASKIDGGQRNAERSPARYVRGRGEARARARDDRSIGIAVCTTRRYRHAHMRVRGDYFPSERTLLGRW